MTKLGNNKKMIELGNKNWLNVKESGMNNLRVRYTNTNRVVTKEGHEFINMCSCSYLGLDRHPKILEGAIKAISEEKTLLLPTSRIRVGLSLIDETEDYLSKLFQCRARVTLSCSAASSGMLPLLASGFLTADDKPIMIFDKQAHFSMNHMKSSCGYETEVLTCEHNDAGFVENICKKNLDKKILYVADGAYSMGGYAPIEELERLQERYGLYLYFDDSHSLSAYGKNGIGYVRSKLKNFSQRTIIASSLGKGFGVSGGVILTAEDYPYEHFVNIFAGPQGWSQTLNVPALGGVIESAKIHKSVELEVLQTKLQENLNYFDNLCPTSEKNNGLPIRIIEFRKPEIAIEMSRELYEKGYYTSAVFFPIVAKGRAGLRVMLRADMTKKDILGFFNSINEVLSKHNEEIINPNL